MIAQLPHKQARPAVIEDVPDLLALEAACFAEDRLSRRSFQRLIRSPSADIVVLPDASGLASYVCTLYRRGTALSRVYSLAIAPRRRGEGLGRQLMASAETQARERGCTHMRLEVRSDNTAGIQLCRALGYRQFAALDDYYADHTPALRLEKRIRVLTETPRTPVPFFAQTTEFTCGGASLMMAMNALDATRPLDRSTELHFWREATTIFMTSGHGGCGPHGLALAAWRRGFTVALYINQSGPLFLDGVRDPDKKAVMALVQEDFKQALQDTDVSVHESVLTAADMADAVKQGRLPVVLISTFRMTGNKAPHWVVVAAADDVCLYVHDPDVDTRDEASATDNAYIPIPRAQFDAMARFGSRGLRTALILGTR